MLSKSFDAFDVSRTQNPYRRITQPNHNMISIDVELCGTHSEFNVERVHTFSAVCVPYSNCAVARSRNKLRSIRVEIDSGGPKYVTSEISDWCISVFLAPKLNGVVVQLWRKEFAVGSKAHCIDPITVTRCQDGFAPVCNSPKFDCVSYHMVLKQGMLRLDKLDRPYRPIVSTKWLFPLETSHTFMVCRLIPTQSACRRG